MSLTNSSAVSQWAAKLPSSSFTRRITPTSIADSNTSLAGNSNDSLVVEDLDLDELDAVRSCSSSADEVSLGEYFICSEPDVDSFFGERIPSVISENNLYILVKVPASAKKHVPISTTASQTTPRSLGLSPNLRINREIFPIQEEEEPKSRRPCWEDQEKFESRTNVIHSHDLESLPNQVPEEPEEPFLEASPKKESPPPAPPPPCQNQIELQEVSLNSAHFKDGANISLKNYGILITPTKAPRTENLLVFQVDTEPKEKRDGHSCSCFGWFMKFFHRKPRTSGFVHAKVYKTYFVKWKKCSDDPKCLRCQCKSLRRNST